MEERSHFLFLFYLNTSCLGSLIWSTHRGWLERISCFPIPICNFGSSVFFILKQDSTSYTLRFFHNVFLSIPIATASVQTKLLRP